MKRFVLPILSVLGLLGLALALGHFHNPLAWTGPAMAMGIIFNSIPNNLRVPFVAVEFSNANASQGPTLLPYNVLLIGQMTSGTATANSIVSVSSASQVQSLAGSGSMLHRMALAYFASNQSTQTYIGVLADNGAGVAATGTLTVTGPATAAGTLSIYIGGQLVSVGVNSGDTATAIAANIVTAVTALTSLPVTAAAAAGVVTLTAKNKGTCGNAIDIRLNYQIGQATPAGVAVAVVAMSAGATNPTLTSLIAAMGDQWFQIIGHPYTDATSLTALENELNSRFGPMRMIDGLGITSAAGTQSTLATLGLGRNNSHNCIVAQPGQNPVTPPEEFAAEVAGVVAYYAQINPAQPFQTLQLAWSQPSATADLFTLTQRNLLLYDGIATSNTVAGKVQLERIITTYQLNASNAPDASYLDSNTMLNLMYLRYTFRQFMTSSFPRALLGQDGVRAGAGTPVVTPLIAKGAAVAWYKNMMDLNLVQNLPLFKSNLVVQVDGTNPNQLDFLLPPDLIGQLMVNAAQIQFVLNK